MFVINKLRADHVVDFAAEELKEYLRMMMPRCGEIAINYDPEAKTGFTLADDSVLNGKVAADGAPGEVFSQVELLHSIGLAAPDTVELCWELNQKGFDLPLDALDEETCAQALYNAVKA